MGFGAHTVHLAADILPEAGDGREGAVWGVGGGGEDHRGALVEVGIGVGETLGMGAAHGVGANKGTTVAEVVQLAADAAFATADIRYNGLWLLLLQAMDALGNH